MTTVITSVVAALIPFIPLVAPLFVSTITQLIKKIPPIAQSGYKNSILRICVAILSFASVIGVSALSQTTVDPTSINAFVDALLVFLGASGTFFITQNTSEVIAGAFGK